MLAVLMVCTLGQDPIECQRPTAHDVITHETEARLPYSCLMEAQQYAAMNSITNHIDRTKYWVKIGCSPKDSQPTDDHL